MLVHSYVHGQLPLSYHFHPFPAISYQYSLSFLKWGILIVQLCTVCTVRTKDPDTEVTGTLVLYNCTSVPKTVYRQKLWQWCILFLLVEVWWVEHFFSLGAVYAPAIKLIVSCHGTSLCYPFGTWRICGGLVDSLCQWGEGHSCTLRLPLLLCASEWLGWIWLLGSELLGLSIDLCLGHSSGWGWICCCFGI